MRSFITAKRTAPARFGRFAPHSARPSRRLWLLAAAAVAALFPLAAAGQKIAVLTPDQTARSAEFARRLETALGAQFRVLDAELSAAAFRAAAFDNPFNLTTDEARTVGASLGCRFFVLVRAVSQRRFSSVKKEYFESYAVVYGVSARTGRLVFWKLQSVDDPAADRADRRLFESAETLAVAASARFADAARAEADETPVVLPEIPAPDSPAGRNFQPPVPYRRVSPTYTATADFYRVAATVDIEVDFDVNGGVTRTTVVRWAGFGLDEAVADNVRRMNWRPAMRDGRPLAVRALLRYNFKKLEKPE